MTIHSATTPTRSPLAAAQSKLIRRILELRTGEGLVDLVKDSANIFDEWLFEIGSHLAETVTPDVEVDLRLFSGQCLGAVDGNATYEIECAQRQSGRRTSARRGV